MRRPLCIAHRGASRSAPENTLPAFHRALRDGADAIELDVRLTRDERVVVVHDERLERTTNGGGWVHRHTRRQLSALDAGVWFAPAYRGTRIPTLTEVLRLVHGRATLHIELKPRAGHARRLASQLLAVLRRGRALSSVVLASFDLQALRACRALHATIPLAVLCSRHPAVALRAARRLRAAAFHPHWSLVTPRLVRDCHALGLRVHPWTVDASRRMRQLLGWGVDGVCTNDPVRLRRIIRTRTR
ncbi:MAG: glycerophosphodiester phosphodiesterase [Candidatus Omnitrophica bacterium]|nr:glycerophosphodiester phosphodiesterase [Candidatus Omnitrophota bacterium]